MTRSGSRALISSASLVVALTAHAKPVTALGSRLDPCPGEYMYCSSFCDDRPQNMCQPQGCFSFVACNYEPEACAGGQGPNLVDCMP